MSQFGVSFQIMFLVVQYHSFLANKASFVHLAAQIKCHLKHEHTKHSVCGRAVKSVTEINTKVRVRILTKPSFLFNLSK